MNKSLIAASVALCCTVSFSAYSNVMPPSSNQMSNYLVIATGHDSDNGYSFNMDGGELGADQEVVTSSSGNEIGGVHGRDFYGSAGWDGAGTDLRGTFTANPNETPFSSDNRWTDGDPGDGGTVGIVDFLPGARTLREAPDFTGNVAITDDNGSFVSENADYFASLGIQCAAAVNDCHRSNDGDNVHFTDLINPQILGDDSLANRSGVSQFDSQSLIDEMNDWQSFIDGLVADVSWGDGSGELKFDGENYKDGSSPLITDLDAIDLAGNDDGFAVFDIDVGDSFLNITNTDWILNSLEDTIAIFRINKGGSYKFDNASVLLGPGCMEDFNGSMRPTRADSCVDDPMTDLGAIFYKGDAKNGTSTDSFNLSNTILGGIGLWDMDGVNDTKIVSNNAQGCVQLISEVVNLSSKSRFNRCALPGDPDTNTSVPEPQSWAILLLALLGLKLRRKNRAES